MKKYSAIILLLVCVFNDSFAQKDFVPQPTPSTFDFGLGIGLDYGGIGGRFTIVPSKNLMTFAAIGYNFAGAGVNAGVGYLVYPYARTCPYFMAMYGYNAVIKIIDASQYDEIYYGPSVGIGVQFRNKMLTNYFNLELIIPFRPQEFSDDYDELKLNPQIELNSKPPPFAFSIGYHFG